MLKSFKSTLFFIVAIFIMSTGCSIDDISHDSNKAKRVIGQMGSNYAISSSSVKRSPSEASSLTYADQVWVISMTRTAPSKKRGGGVSLNYGAMLENKQIFDITDGGSFELLIEDRCELYHQGGTECVGYVLLLVDSTQKEKKDQIKGFLALNGKRSLMKIPFMKLTEDLDLGTLNRSIDGASEEIVGADIEDVATKFSTLDVNDLKMIAASDDYVKLIKNLYINNDNLRDLSDGLSLLRLYYHFIDTNIEVDKYTDIAHLKPLGASVRISATEKMAGLPGPFYLIPPAPTMLDKYNYNWNHVLDTVEVNATDGVEWENLQGLFASLPTGYWKIVDVNSKVYAYYDVATANPYDEKTSKIKTFIPSIKANSDVDGKIKSFSIKWFYYDGKEYLPLVKDDAIYKDLSKLSVFMSTQREYYDLTAFDTSEVNISIPCDSNGTKISIHYAFYSAEIWIRYTFK